MPLTAESLFKEREITFEENVNLNDLTTWRVGGPARYFLIAGDMKSLVGTIEVASESGIELMIIGNGSNVLVSDEGIDRIVVRLGADFRRIEVSGNILNAGAGALLGSVATTALENELAGFEFSFGIPGTIGGAVMTNAGAFGSQLADVLVKIDTLTVDGEKRDYTTFNNRYRTGLVPANEIVTGATLRLCDDSEAAIRRRMDEARAMRKKTQPWGMPTAGSVFKNPVGNSAGKLIEDCGLKGKIIGGARVSDIHGNFIINDGNATAMDIKSLIELMRRIVLERFEITLELEVQMVGFKEA